VVKAGIDALKSHGAGLSSVRFICGTQDIHKVKIQVSKVMVMMINKILIFCLKALEEKISKFHGREDTILYASCFDANAGLFEQLLGPEDAIISDELNHASIIDGIRLCKAKKFRYSHKDMTGKKLNIMDFNFNAFSYFLARLMFKKWLFPFPRFKRDSHEYNNW